MRFLYVLTIATAQAAAFSNRNGSSVHPLSVPAVGGHRSKYHTKRYSNNSKLNLSPSISGLLVRGGSASAAPVLKDFYGDALGYFGGIRIPATFLAGSSLAAIFTLKDAANKLMANNSEEELTPLEKTVVKAYHVFSLLAFLLSLNTIVTATVAHTSILHGRFNEMAETAYMLMKREFEFEFVSVRWSFLSSIFMFLGMVSSRMLIEFGLCKTCNQVTKRKDMAMLTVCSIGGLATHLMSYVNQSLWCWQSFPSMTVYLSKLIFARAFVERRPLQIISVLMTAMSAFYVAKLAFDTKYAEED